MDLRDAVGRIEVVRGRDLKKADSTSGITRSRAFETESVLCAQSRVAGKVTSGWHHHGERDLFGFLVAGRLRLEYGDRGRDAAELSPGDFFHIPAGLVHRDVNPDDREEAVIVNIMLGSGPTVVNVSGPDRGEGKGSKVSGAQERGAAPH